MITIAIGVVVVVAVAGLSVTALRRLAAHLEPGTPAPEFTLEAAKGGTVQTIELHQILARGPVVLYFYPKSFTSGCTVEAYLFAERAAEFEHLGATVIGVSGDDIETQKRFSTQECQSAFLVASDPGLQVAKRYAAALALGFANRISYVIAHDGTIAYWYASLDPSRHVGNVLAALGRLVPADWSAGAKS